jgi:hypothetical protein
MSQSVSTGGAYMCVQYGCRCNTTNLPGHEEGIKPLQCRNDAKGSRNEDEVPKKKGL